MRGVVLAVWIDMGLDGDGGAEDVHGDGVLVVDEIACGFEEVYDWLGEGAVGGEVGFESGEFVGCWFVANDEEVGDFFEGCVCCEVCDFVATVDEGGLFDIADFGFACDDAFEAFGVGGCGGHGGYLVVFCV